MFLFPQRFRPLLLATLLVLPWAAAQIARADDVRQVNVPVDGLIFNPADGLLYGGIVSGPASNSIVSINPQTAALGAAVSLDSTPQDMVISSDGRFIDTVVAGGNGIRRFDTTTQTAGIQWALGNDYSALYAEDLVALPNLPGSVAVSRANRGISPRHKDIVIYDNGVLRVGPQASGANFIEVNPAGTRLYGYQPEVSSFEFNRWDIDASGLTNRTTVHPFDYNADFKIAGARAYSTNGIIFDPETAATIANFPSRDMGLFVPDLATNKLFTASQNGTTLTIDAQSLTTLAPLGSISVPNVNGSAGRLLRWGSNGLAFRTATQVFLVRTQLVGTAAPVITGVNPNAAMVGASVVLTGGNLQGATSVSFNGTNAAFQVNSDTQITATVPPNATSGPITVTTAGGSVITPTFTVVPPPPPTLSVSDVSIVEGNSGSQNLGFTVSLSRASSEAVSLNFATADGTALAGADYTAQSGTVSLPAGQTSQTVQIAVVGDLIDESDETFSLNLSEAQGATLSRPQAVATIIDDDATPAISISDVKVNEDNAVSVGANFTVRLSNPSAQTVKVNFVTFDGTAIAPGDYAAKNGTLSFAPGQTSQLLTISVRGDTIDEPNETFGVKLFAPVAASIGDDTGTGTIFDNDAVPTLSVRTTSVTEGNAGTSALSFEIKLSNASDRMVSVQVKTVASKTLPATAGSDYAPLSTTVSFAPGEVRKIVSVSVAGDTLDEENEHVTLQLRSPVSAALGAGAVGGVLEAEGIIIDDDAVPSLSIGDLSLSEGNSGTKQAVLTVSLSAPSGRAVTVSFATLSGSAIAGSDFAGQSGSLTFAPGQTRQTISIPIYGDTAVEANEGFKITLSNGVNAGIAHPTGIVTILNDDSAAAAGTGGGGTGGGGTGVEAPGVEHPAGTRSEPKARFKPRNAPEF